MELGPRVGFEQWHGHTLKQVESDLGVGLEERAGPNQRVGKIRGGWVRAVGGAISGSGRARAGNWSATASYVCVPFSTRSVLLAWSKSTRSYCLRRTACSRLSPRYWEEQPGPWAVVRGGV